MKKVIKLTAHDVAVYREIRTGEQNKPNIIHAAVAMLLNIFVIGIFVTIKEEEFVSDAEHPPYD